MNSSFITTLLGLLLFAGPVIPIYAQERRTTDDPAAQSDSKVGPATETKPKAIRGLGRGRTLVLTDGVPLNDPFGGWIHWNKVPLNEIVRAEIVRGATSNLYGSLAMAGVIQYLTAPTYEKRLFAQVDGGNLNSYHGNFTTADPLGENFSGGIYGDFYRTDGYPIVKNRGPVDKPASFESNHGGLKLTWKPSSQLTAFMAANYYLEGRDSGTKKTNNDWWFGDGTAGVDYRTEGGSNWQFRLFGGGEQFSNNNSSINAARTTEVRTLHQDIPVRTSAVRWYGRGLSGNRRHQRFVHRVAERRR
jgi:outer membrane receptor for ferrienterochelin and colicin